MAPDVLPVFDSECFGGINKQTNKQKKKNYLYYSTAQYITAK